MLNLPLVVNGREIAATVPSNQLLVDFLRDNLQLTGCHVACDGFVCGACTVLVDGSPTTACSTFVFEVAESDVETIESLRQANGALHPVQQAFLEKDAFQCGFCTSGLIMSVKALLAHNPDPDETAIVEWLNAHVCRCTGYQTIIEAVQLAASLLRRDSC